MRLRRREVLRASVLAPLAVADHWGSADAQIRTVIRAVPEGDLNVLDPIWTTAYITRNHGYKVWDTLFALDAQNRPQPQMVETYSVSDDQLTLPPGGVRQPAAASWRARTAPCGRCRRLNPAWWARGRNGVLSNVLLRQGDVRSAGNQASKAVTAPCFVKNSDLFWRHSPRSTARCPS